MPWCVHWPRWDPASTGRPHRTCTGARPPAGPRWPQSCSDCVWRQRWVTTTTTTTTTRRRRPSQLRHLLLSGILVAQLLKEPDTKTSLAEPAHLKTVGRAWALGLLLSLSRSCCQARNSWISCGAWRNTAPHQITSNGGDGGSASWWTDLLICCWLWWQIFIRDRWCALCIWDIKHWMLLSLVFACNWLVKEEQK